MVTEIIYKNGSIEVVDALYFDNERKGYERDLILFVKDGDSARAISYNEVESPTHYELSSALVSEMLQDMQDNATGE